MSVKKNVIANYVGQGWSAVVALIFIPVYIKYLGVEAYGLIGLFAVVQAWLALLDMGMTPTLTREMARYMAGAHAPQSIRDLLRSLEIICFGIAILACLAIAASSGYLASEWLRAERIPTEVAAQALSIMAFVIALRFVEGIYRGSLFGLQRQVWYNAVNAVLATVRHGGAVAVLAWLSPTIQAFFLWQVLCSLLTTFVFAIAVHRALPKSPVPPRFSPEAISRIWKYASGVFGISLLALLLTQVDKVLLSRMVTLETFGYYTLAATVAGVVFRVIGPVTQAIYPRMVELSSSGRQASLISIYHRGAQLITILTAPAVMLLCFYPGGVIFMWSGDIALSEHTAPILSALALGSFLNGVMWMPYQCQLAYGWTALALRVNIVAVALLLPAMFWAIPRYGALGAAWIWVILNAGYVLVSTHFMHQRLLQCEKWRWYVADLALPSSGAVVVVLIARHLQPSGYIDRWHWFAFLIITGALALLASLMLADRARQQALAHWRSCFHAPNSRQV